MENLIQCYQSTHQLKANPRTNIISFPKNLALSANPTLLQSFTEARVLKMDTPRPEYLIKFVGSCHLPSVIVFCVCSNKQAHSLLLFKPI